MLQHNSELAEIGLAEDVLAFPENGHRSDSSADPIQYIRELQVKRRFCIKLQIRQENAVRALIARYCGYSSLADEATRAKLFRKAGKILAAWGKERANLSEDEKRAGMLAADEIAMFFSVQEPLRKRRADIEKEMRALVRFLPGYEFAASVAGFGELGFAVLVAEAGDLAKYPHDRLWKRLGLAPYEGKAYSAWRKAGGLTSEQWVAGGFSPHRLAEIFSCITEPLFRRQSMVSRKPNNQYSGYYRDVYNVRRAKCERQYPEWSKAHLHNDAMRIMTKKLIRDLWRAWRRDVAELAAA